MNASASRHKRNVRTAGGCVESLASFFSWMTVGGSDPDGGGGGGGAGGGDGGGGVGVVWMGDALGKDREVASMMAEESPCAWQA